MKTSIHKYKFWALAVTLFICVSGFSQNALHFDGTDDYVTAPAASNLISSASGISLSLWVYPENAAAGWPDFDGFAGFRNNSNADFYIMQLGSSDVEARFRNSAGGIFTLSYSGLNLNTWNHFVLTYDGATLTLYHNGSSVTNMAANGTITSTTTELQVGYLFYTTAGNSFYLKGKLEDVSLWDKGLSTAEVSTLYNSCGIDLNNSNLKLCYEFNQGVAGGSNTAISSVTDSKSTTNGTINNMALSGTASNFIEGISGNTTDTIDVVTCDEYTVPSGNKTYTASGTYNDTIANAAGCDSILTINLVINSVNISVTQNGDTLFSQAAGASRQWINCSDNSAVTGETGQVFIPSISGDYAVVVTENSCTDTSACFNVTITVPPTGVMELASNFEVSMYPNPVSNEFYLNFSNTLESVNVEISSITGKTIMSGLYRNAGKLHFSLDGSSGIYFVKITTDNKVKVLKILKS